MNFSVRNKKNIVFFLPVNQCPTVSLSLPRIRFLPARYRFLGNPGEEERCRIDLMSRQWQDFFLLLDLSTGAFTVQCSLQTLCCRLSFNSPNHACALRFLAFPAREDFPPFFSVDVAEGSEILFCSYKWRRAKRKYKIKTCL